MELRYARRCEAVKSQKKKSFFFFLLRFSIPILATYLYQRDIVECLVARVFFFRFLFFLISYRHHLPDPFRISRLYTTSS